MSFKRALKFPAYHEKYICPVETMSKYIKDTETFRGEITRLFIATTKLCRKASEDKWSRWVKSILQKAGIDMNIFLPHSTRNASTSMAKTTHLTLDTVLKAGGWKSMKTFAKH